MRTLVNAPATRHARFLRPSPQTALFAALLALGIFAISIPYQPADTDEAWLGEQAYYRQLDGVARSPMFPGINGEGQRTVVQHRLLTETGAWAIAVCGWGLWPLRVVPIVFTILLLVIFGLHMERRGPRGSGWPAICLLIISPLCFHWGKIFRPEILVATFAFGCLLAVQTAYRNRSIGCAFIAGALAGAAACAHYNGIVVIAAAAATFFILRRLRLGLAVLIGAGLALAPYLWEIIRHWELFRLQLFQNPMIAGKVGGSWMTWLLSVMQEHKRLFRSPEILVLTVPFLLALLSTTTSEFQRRKVWYLFWFILMFFIAVIVKSKLARYALLLHPFFVGEIVRVWTTPAAFRSHLGRAIPQWLYTIILAGSIVGCLVIDWHATGRSVASPEKTSERWAHYIPQQSTVVAPPVFAFNQLGKYHIVALAHIRFNLVRNFADKISPEAFFAACADIHAEYIIIPRDVPEYEDIAAATGENLYRQYVQDPEVVFFRRLPTNDKNHSPSH